MNKKALVLTLSILFYVQSFLILVSYFQYGLYGLPYAFITNVVLGTAFVLAVIKNKNAWKVTATVLLAVASGMIFLQLVGTTSLLNMLLEQYTNEISLIYPNYNTIELYLQLITLQTFSLLLDTILIAVYIIYIVKIQNFKRFVAAKHIIMGLLIGAGVIRLLLTIMSDIHTVEHYFKSLLAIATYVILILVVRLDLSEEEIYVPKIKETKVYTNVNNFELSIEDKLKQLEFLLSKQLISKEEYDDKRKEIINQI